MFRWKGFRKELENDYPVSGPTLISFSGVIYQMNADSKRCCQFVDSTSDSTPHCVSIKWTQANSQVPDCSGIPPVALAHA